MHFNRSEGAHTPAHPLQPQGGARAVPGRLPGASFLNTWLEGRLPRGEVVTLGHRSVYILPTGFGIMFALVVLVLLAASINYSLSLGFVLTFLLAGLDMVAMLHTWRSLAGLRFRAGRVEPVFAGDTVRFSVRVEAERPSPALLMRAGDGDSQLLMADPAGELLLPVTSERRGWLALPRIKVSTVWPLGLFRAWAWLELSGRTLVYPRPSALEESLPVAPGGEDAGAGNDQGGWDDFWGFRAFRPGDSPRHLAWKHLARSDTLLTKEFVQPGGGEIWLDWDQFSGEVEERLSRLTRLVLDLDRGGLCYGLRLPEVALEPDHGSAHMHRCLSALALFGQPQPGSSHEPA